MNRGKLITSWAEPDAWYKVVQAQAKEDGQSIIPWSWSSFVTILVGTSIILTLDWSDADPVKRVSVPMLIVLILVLNLVLNAFIFVMMWLTLILGRKGKTKIYEHGVTHGSLIKKRWIPWSEFDYFYIDDGPIRQHEFRFLNWSRQGADDEEYSVLPDNVDLDLVANSFKENQVEQQDMSDD